MAYNFENLTKQVKDIFQYNWGCPDDELVHVDEMMREWEKNKHHIYKAFNNQLIYELPAEQTIHISSDTKKSKVRELCDWIEENMFDVPNCFDLIDFIEEIGEDLFYNVLKYDYGFFDVEADTEKLVKSGSKITKAFKHFISDKNVLTEIQNRVSVILQEDTITGKICFSIHPLDFLSMSNNIYNWTTCQELREGERRMGTLSYMLDTSSFVCYIKGADGIKLPIFPEHIPWNSKRWRVLLHTNIHHSIFMIGRQYPFELEPMANHILETLPEIFKDIGFISNWQREKTILNEYGDAMEGYFNIFNSVFLKERIVLMHPHSLNYNDLLYSSVYEPQLCYDTINYGNITPMFVGNRVKCFKCGVADIETSVSHLCANCFNEKYSNEVYPYHFCSICGDVLNSHTEKIITTERQSRKIICKDCHKDYIIGKY